MGNNAARVRFDWMARSARQYRRLDHSWLTVRGSLVLLLPASAALAAAAVWPVSTGGAPKPAVAPTQTPPAAIKTARRIYVTRSQLTQAYAAGLIDRPVRSILNLPHPLAYGEFVWDEQGVPNGPVWVRVDLSLQLISVFRSGEEIGTAVILYGANKKETPRGIFPIMGKDKDHRSSTYGDAPMPYMLRLTGDGVSIHGSKVQWGYATHGCIGVPLDFAKRLFDQVHKGDPVVILSSSRPA